MSAGHRLEADNPAGPALAVGRDSSAVCRSADERADLRRLAGKAADRGSRAAGMGGAYVAIADDARAAFVNPAGLTQIPVTELSVSSGLPWASAATGRQRLRIAAYSHEGRAGGAALARSGASFPAAVRLGGRRRDRRPAVLSRAAGCGRRVWLPAHRRGRGLVRRRRSRPRARGPDRRPGARHRGGDGGPDPSTVIGASPLKLGASFQPGVSWAVPRPGEDAVEIRRPSLSSVGLAWRASNSWSYTGQIDIIRYHEVVDAAAQRGRGRRERLLVVHRRRAEGRRGVRDAAPLRLRHGEDPRGDPLRVAGHARLRRERPPAADRVPVPLWRTTLTLGASFFAEHSATRCASTSTPATCWTARPSRPAWCGGSDRVRLPAWLLLVAVLPACAPKAAPRALAPVPEAVGHGCPPERARSGEVRLVFLGDSGYGTGVSEWGTHGQEAVANHINHLGLQPDLVFFLGDNIYWLGNTDLYKSRFDDMYDPLIRQCRAHVALGNHDVKAAARSRSTSTGRAASRTCARSWSPTRRRATCARAWRRRRPTSAPGRRPRLSSRDRCRRRPWPPARPTASWRRDRLRERGGRPVLCARRPDARPVRVRVDREGRPSPEPAAALLLDPLPGAQDQPRRHRPRPPRAGGRGRVTPAGERHGAGLEHAAGRAAACWARPSRRGGPAAAALAAQRDGRSGASTRRGLARLEAAGHAPSPRAPPQGCACRLFGKCLEAIPTRRVWPIS